VNNTNKDRMTLVPICVAKWKAPFMLPSENIRAPWLRSLGACFQGPQRAHHFQGSPKSGP